MASLYIGLNRGQQNMNQADVLNTGSTDPGTDVVLRVDLTKGWTRKELNDVHKVFQKWLISQANTQVLP